MEKARRRRHQIAAVLADLLACAAVEPDEVVGGLAGQGRILDECAGLQAAFLLGGAVVTETMFSWPGVGRLAVGAIVSSDFPTAQGAIMILAIAFLTINLLVDVLYVYLDPRVQRS